MVLFRYNRIYRDQTFSARIMRGMLVAGYKSVHVFKVFKIQKRGGSCFCRGFCVPTHNKNASSLL